MRRRGGGRREEAADPRPGQPAVAYARLIACLKRADAPLSLPEISRALGLDADDEPALRRQMEFLAKEGIVFSHRRGRWTLHARARVVIGRLSSPRRTFGFVTPEDGSGRDLYVAGRRMSGARHGDLVMARAIGPGERVPRRGGAGEAEIVAVLERRPPFVAGLFHGDAAGGVVIPRDDRIADEIVVDAPPQGAAGAAGAAGAPGGIVVWAEILSPGDRFRPARGRILEALGPADQPGVDRTVIERTYDLPGHFPPEAEREASRLGQGAAPAVREGREDFTGATVVTVDPATARDHDDAVGLEQVRTPRGPVQRLSVHIADVSHYVTEGGAIDREALRRGTSVYFPGGSIPMLPETLSTDLCSLVPGRDRLVQSVLIDFDDQGRPLHHRFADGVIRSAASLTYDEVTASLEGRAARGGPIDAMLDRMRALSGALRARRLRRGSLDLDLPETEVIVDGEGRPVDVRATPHTVAHEIIEEFMLAANETVAGHLKTAMGPPGAALYRIHEDPEPAGLDQVEQDLADMGFPVRRTRGAASARIRSLLAGFRGRPEEPAVAMMVLRSLKLARYSHEAVGHFGLAAPLYTHFTSPIRRYPDLVVHRLLRGSRRAGWHPDPGAGQRLESIALECSRLERRAEEAERAMVAWKEAVYMKDRVGREYQGVVTGLTSNALFVTLEGPGVEGIVPLSPPREGRPARGRGNRRGATRTAPAARPRWRLGDALRVRVQSVDTFRARVLLRPLSTG